jgi:hypothetical protein
VPSDGQPALPRQRAISAMAHRSVKPSEKIKVYPAAIPIGA